MVDLPAPDGPTRAVVVPGAATKLTRSQLVTDQNCQNCHTTLRAHGENRYGVAMCVLFHTNGAEDLNNPNAVAGETLGLSISFQTMIHKIHSGAHLPSVNGKTVDANGNPVYGTGTPYVIVRSRGEFDFSEVAFPQWPHLAQGMPRDLGYTALSSANKTKEGMILSGPTNCVACHGDPDGDGPLPAPTKSRPAGTLMSAETGPVAAPLLAMRLTPSVNVAPFTTRSGTLTVGAHTALGAA
jgi:OmcA/MtrC family decaheme c-type cytochrome